MFGLINSVILLIESPKIAHARNIRDFVDSKLLEKSGFDFETLPRNFTVVTDAAAVMAKIGSSSVTRNIAVLNEI